LSCTSPGSLPPPDSGAEPWTLRARTRKPGGQYLHRSAARAAARLKMKVEERTGDAPGTAEQVKARTETYGVDGSGGRQGYRGTKGASMLS
jgi:hypothetical protein